MLRIREQLSGQVLVGTQPAGVGISPVSLQMSTMSMSRYSRPGLKHFARKLLAEVGAHRGHLVCVHLYLVDGLPKDTNSMQGLFSFHKCIC